MSIRIRAPWTITMSPVGPSIEYVQDYRFNRTVNVNDNTSTLNASGPGEMFGVEVKDERAEEIYRLIGRAMEINRFRLIKVGMTGQVSVEWEEIEGIQQAMHLAMGGREFSALWRVGNIAYDDGDFAIEAARTVVAALDPGQVAGIVENLVENVSNMLDELFTIASEVGRF